MAEGDQWARRVGGAALDSPAGPPRRPVYLNGKFYSGALNGVHRVADRLIREVDQLASEGPQGRWDLRLLLPDGPTWAPDLKVTRKVEQHRARHQLWEQAVLPIRAAGGVLVNLANLAPVLHFRKLSMIHDAQFLISPESFSPRFRTGYRLLTPLIARTSAKVLTVSEYARESLSAFKISPHDRTRVVYNGGDHILEVEPDHAVVRRLGLPVGRFVLMFAVGAAYKNLAVVFAAFDRPELRDMVLVLVGGDREQLESAGLKPPAQAVFAGRIDDRALRALYEDALCLAFPSRTEGFGLPPLEAMLCGCPVVAAPAGAMPEVCRDAVLYADVFDPAGWAKQIFKLQTRPELRGEKIAAGFARGRDFTWREAGRRLFHEIGILAAS